MGRVVHHDEKLASRAVRPGRTGHRNNAFGVLQRIVKPVGGKLSLDAVPRPAGTHSLGISALDHKSGDNTVKDHAVIKSLLHQRYKIFHSVRGDIRIQLYFHFISVFHFNGNDRVFHGNVLLFQSYL